MPLIQSAPDAASRIYARSLIDLAHNAGGRERVEQILGELEGIVDLARTDPKFAEFLSSRAISTDERSKSIRQIFTGRISETTRNFLLVLNDKGRLGEIVTMTAAYDEAVQAKFGRVEVDVYTAQAMDQGALEDVRSRLARALGKEVVVHPYTDVNMIGGVKFQIGDQLIDASIQTRLRQVRDQIEREGAAKLRGSAGSMIA
jgi:F-type H+-transporting ATPase subunit delta